MSPATPHRFALTSVLALVFAACSGGGGGGDAPPDLEPNTAPIVPVPSGLAGSMPRLSWSVLAGASESVQFVAADAESDPLTWQVVASGQTAAAVGLRLPAVANGNTVTLELEPVTVPGSGVVTLFVQDPRQAVFAFDVTVVRGGAPSLASVSPDSAFGGRPLRIDVRGSVFDLGGTAQPQVRFGGVLATQVQVADNTRLSCLTSVLPQSGPVDVTVTTNYGGAGLPVGAFRMLSFPPSFPNPDARVDGGSADVVELALDGARACAATVGGGALSLAASADGGRTFGAPVVASGGEQVTEPVLLAVGSRVYAAWIGNGQEVHVRRSDDGGSTFAPSVTAVPSGSPVQGLGLVATGQRVHVSCVRGNASLGQARAVVASSSDGAQSFGSPRPVATSSANQSALAIGADGTSVFAVWLDDRLGAAVRGVYVARSTDSGFTWLADRRLSAPDRAAANLHAAREGAAMHAVWTTSDGLYANGTTDRGQSWRTPEVPVATLADGAPESPFVHVAGDRVQVIYTTNGTEVRLARSTDAGASFPVRTRLDADAAPDSGVVLAGEGDYTTAAWLSGDAGADAVRAVFSASTDGGGTFSTPTGFGNGASNQGGLRLRQSGGRLLLGFLERRGLAIGGYANANGD